ncbi:hypothetical protein HK102_002073 [Quaeritorhiza haematococci]|nr:hypothetical protein HK102_002073 [Quaeritorhiza haematococci]
MGNPPPDARPYPQPILPPSIEPSTARTLEAAERENQYVVSLRAERERAAALDVPRGKGQESELRQEGVLNRDETKGGEDPLQERLLELDQPLKPWEDSRNWSWMPRTDIADIPNPTPDELPDLGPENTTPRDDVEIKDENLSVEPAVSGESQTTQEHASVDGAHLEDEISDEQEGE